jgi:hypothetical protein
VEVHLKFKNFVFEKRSQKDFFFSLFSVSPSEKVPEEQMGHFQEASCPAAS